MSICHPRVNICRRSYGIDGALKRTSISSKRVAVASHKYRIMLEIVVRASDASARGSRRAVIFVFFIAKNSLEFFREIGLKKLEKP